MKTTIGGSHPETALDAEFSAIIADALKSVPLEPEDEGEFSRFAGIGRLDRSITTLEGFALEHAVRAVLTDHGQYRVLEPGIRFPLPKAALQMAEGDGEPTKLEIAPRGAPGLSYCPDLVAIGIDGELVLGELKRDTAHLRPNQIQPLMVRLKAAAMVSESVLNGQGEAIEVRDAFVSIIDATGKARHAAVHDFEAFGSAIGDPDFAPAMHRFRTAFYLAADAIYAAHVDACRPAPVSTSPARRFVRPLYAPFTIRSAIGSVRAEGGLRA